MRYIYTILINTAYGLFMHLDPALIVVVAAVLLFYLRIIILQRRRAQQVRQQNLRPKSQVRKVAEPAAGTGVSYSILSQKPIDRLIGAAGLFLVIIGLLLYAGVIKLPTIQPY